jgi:hypothetical protein
VRPARLSGPCGTLAVAVVWEGPGAGCRAPRPCSGHAWFSPDAGLLVEPTTRVLTTRGTLRRRFLAPPRPVFAARVCRGLCARLLATRTCARRAASPSSSRTAAADGRTSIRDRHLLSDVGIRGNEFIMIMINAFATRRPPEAPAELKWTGGEAMGRLPVCVGG